MPSQLGAKNSFTSPPAVLLSGKCGQLGQEARLLSASQTLYLWLVSYAHFQHNPDAGS